MGTYANDSNSDSLYNSDSCFCQVEKNIEPTGWGWTCKMAIQSLTLYRFTSNIRSYWDASSRMLSTGSVEYYSTQTTVLSNKGAGHKHINFSSLTFVSIVSSLTSLKCCSPAALLAILLQPWPGTIYWMSLCLIPPLHTMPSPLLHGSYVIVN